MAHFEKDLKVSKSIGDAEGIASAKADIAHAKSLYEGGSNNEEVLKASQEINYVSLNMVKEMNTLLMRVKTMLLTVEKPTTRGRQGNF